MFNKFVMRIIIFIFICFSSSLYAEEKNAGGQPPAIVVVSEISTGMIAPESEFVGTVYYREVSDLAAEVSGKVEETQFEEGQRVNRGALLVRLSSDLLIKTLEAQRASYEQAMAELDKARSDLRRAELLYKEELIAEQLYDEPRFRARGLEKKADSLLADVERLETEIKKKEITSPYKGIIIKKHVERGEWLSPGSIVATIANDEDVDIIAEVPESVIHHTGPGMTVSVSAGGRELTGKIIAIIPRGDISTRMFPVKVRLKNVSSLIEGMEAMVNLPTGKREKTLTVSRDAVINVYGNTVVYTVNESKAMMVPVKVIGYDGMIAGIEGEGLSEGMKVVVKGNERLQQGQAVVIQQ